MDSINIPVVCAGTLDNPGDVIVAGDDCVVVPLAAWRDKWPPPPRAKPTKPASARLDSGLLGLDMYNIRQPLADAGLHYLD